MSQIVNNPSDDGTKEGKNHETHISSPKGIDKKHKDAINKAFDSDNDEFLSQVMKKSNWKVNIASKPKPLDYSKLCSICLNTSENKDLIVTCKCQDRNSHQHRQCIESWIEETGVNQCSFCSEIYNCEKKPANLIKYIGTYKEVRNIFLKYLAAIFYLIYLTVLGLVIVAWITNNRLSRITNLSLIVKVRLILSTIVVSIGTSTTMALLIWITVNFGKRYYSSYKAWSRSHFKVHVIEYKESKRQKMEKLNQTDKLILEKS